MSANPKLRGMSYEQASREGERLIAKVHKEGNWHAIVDDLVYLRDLMKILAGSGT
ncbi:hypothetical protein GOA89_13145 [Sinorhizobium meliloti]|nr:hypothetical protein [Sinorhizobium meliloti]MDX0622446.1 hypothetical protein [Sinorhizobium medicae]MDW9847242.1 hypothetical protein [Sinorhizobium meliloti]MDX0147567.1 hypothetical protein [Sinorhizobium meliloti]MDX0150070.1 hypothetical protein [Sinorhizobium meliloti]